MADKSKILAAYVAGTPVADIAARHKVSKQYVSAVARQYGVSRKSVAEKGAEDLTQHPPFGKLTVVERLRPAKFGGHMWRCLCECGNETEVPTGGLLSGQHKSCGCGQGRGKKQQAGEVRPREIAMRKLLVKTAIAAGYTPQEIGEIIKASRATIWRDSQE